MKKEDQEKSQQETGSIGNKSISRNEQKNPTGNISSDQGKDIYRQAGLGRDRMTYIEDLEGIKGRENFADDNDDLKNENLNAANDQ
jgi:hypothetical protein